MSRRCRWRTGCLAWHRDERKLEKSCSPSRAPAAARAWRPRPAAGSTSQRARPTMRDARGRATADRRRCANEPRNGRGNRPEPAWPIARRSTAAGRRSRRAPRTPCAGPAPCPGATTCMAPCTPVSVRPAQMVGTVPGTPQKLASAASSVSCTVWPCGCVCQPCQAEPS